MKMPKLSWKSTLVVMGLLILAFGVGRFTGGGDERHAAKHDEEIGKDETHSGQKYVCPMNISYHPYFSSQDPDEPCGFCGMKLVPDKSGGEDLGERMLSMSESAMKLAEVRTAPVEQKFVDLTIPLVGKVDYDETRVKTISAWTAGRLDRLYVDYTGVPVKKGEHLVEIYSPELYTAQEELLQAVRADREIGETSNGNIGRTSKATIEAVREKLRLLGLNEEQIAAIQKQSAPSMLTEIKAPIGGIVIEKHATEGMYVKTGTPIYTVADLSKLWVQLDAYESDLAWIKYGQEVEILTESYGDKGFKGWISFVDPTLDPQTRTVKVRVVVDNADGLLRPNMFVRAAVKARVGEEGVVLAGDLADKWICPMHPEEVKDEPGDCGVCGMDLVQAGQLGYASNQVIGEPVVVPVTAVLRTGKRAVVYRKVSGKARPTFEGLQIEIGPRAGDYYIVRSGLKAGDQVVVNGAFKVDSALQLQAKPSMMSPVDEPDVNMEPTEGKPVLSTETEEALTRLVKTYFEVQKALVEDKPEHAAHQATETSEIATGMVLPEQDADTLKKGLEEIAGTAGSLAAEKEIQKQRELFAILSASLEKLLLVTGAPKETKVYKAYCPMAFDFKGAYWLQPGETVLNPYFGDAMLNCGEIKGPVGEGVEETHHEAH